MGLKAELVFLHFQFEQILEVRPFDILQEEPFQGLNCFSYERLKTLTSTFSRESKCMFHIL